MIILHFLWIYFMPIYWLCGFIGGIYLIIAGIKYLKLLVSVMGLLCLTLVVLPIVCWGTGIDAEFLLTPVSNFSLFSLSGLITGFIGFWSKIKGIRNMGVTIFTCGVIGALFYYLMSIPDSYYIG